MAGSDSPAPDDGRAPATETVSIAPPSLRGVLRIVLIIVCCTIALYLLWRVRSVVGLLFMSVFLALAAAIRIILSDWWSNRGAGTTAGSPPRDGDGGGRAARRQVQSVAEGES